MKTGLIARLFSRRESAMNIPGHAIVDGQRLEVRVLAVADIEPLVRIRNDQRMSPFQYMPDADYPQRLHSITKTIEKYPDADCFHHVVTLGGVSVGEIILNGMRSKITCGWNLDPEFWGRGIMPSALQLYFNAIFAREPAAVIWAECFLTNGRCIRMIDKLGFARVEWTLAREWLTDLFKRDSRPVLRFQLDNAGFKNRQLNTIDASLDH